ncbi:MAG TPA: DUF1801 domain-containing protein [Flavipsychrobacter sp.]|nr:DUF1801 domain-containing protein [Flavipsychrobacter sp.]
MAVELEFIICKTKKDSLHFPHDQPLPTELIKKIILRKLKNMSTISKEILAYNNTQTAEYKSLCDTLAKEISTHLHDAENKIWHGHPVWFLEGNPITGYSKEKKGLRLMFWSGADFNEKQLSVRGEKFKDASIFYQSAGEINTTDLKRWLEKSSAIQWDYKNIVKRKGVLERLK